MDQLANVSRDARRVARILWNGPEFYNCAYLMDRSAEALHGASMMANGDSDAWLSYLAQSASALAGAAVKGANQ